LYQGAQIIGYAHIQLFSSYQAATLIFFIIEEKRNQGFEQQFLNLIKQ
jgi:hypothetical protein